MLYKKIKKEDPQNWMKVKETRIKNLDKMIFEVWGSKGNKHKICKQNKQFMLTKMNQLSNICQK